MNCQLMRCPFKVIAVAELDGEHATLCVCGVHALTLAEAGSAVTWLNPPSVSEMDRIHAHLEIERRAGEELAAERCRVSGCGSWATHAVAFDERGEGGLRCAVHQTTRVEVAA